MCTCANEGLGLGSGRQRGSADGPGGQVSPVHSVVLAVEGEAHHDGALETQPQLDTTHQRHHRHQKKMNAHKVTSRFNQITTTLLYNVFPKGSAILTNGASTSVAVTNGTPDTETSGSR